MSLLVLGTIGLDDLETPFGKRKGVLGGSGTYSAVAASFFTRPSLLSVVGKDFPSVYLKLFSDHKIDLSHLQKSKKPTFRWRGRYFAEMGEAKSLKTELGALADFRLQGTGYRGQGIQKSATHNLKPATHSLVLLANFDPKFQLDLISRLPGTYPKPYFIADTMNYWIEKRKPILLEVIKKSFIFVLNEGEARLLFETPNLIKAGRSCLELGPEYVIIKKGEHGAILFSHDQFFSAPGYPLEEVLDPTGAGDSFAGALSGYLVKTKDYSLKNVKSAVIYASSVASFCAEGFGLERLQKIKMKDILERYEVFKRISRF